MEASVPITGLNAAPMQDEFLKNLGSITAKWRIFGSLLSIPPNDLNGIDDKYNKDPFSCFLEVFSRWQKSAQPPFNWKTIVDILETDVMDEKALSLQLISKYDKN